MKHIFMVAGLFLGMTTLTAQAQPDEKEFLIVAHRGASYLAPENTLASIQLAWELGADAAECDIMLTADNQVILFHDKDTRRLAGENLTISEAGWGQLKRLTIKQKETDLADIGLQNIPLLKEVLATVPEDRMLVIEIKTGPVIIPHLKQVIDEHWKSGRISFIAFDLETIVAAKKLFPDVPCYYLSAFKGDVAKQFEAVLVNNLDGMDLRHGIIDKKMAEKCLGAGLDLWCWTVNDPKTALEMISLGVTAITTDRPKWLKDNL